jgi:CheY-like chemotaxis protein/anti-anti-sigma regulatory factor
MVPKKILIIDDEPLVLKSISLMLKKTGIIGIGARGGAQGLELAAKDSPDAILLDLKMAKMSGWEVLAKIKKDERLEKIPVIIFSAEPVPQSLQVCKDLGVVGILQKPVKMESLKEIFELLEAPQSVFQDKGKQSGSAGGKVRRIVVERNMTGPFVDELEKRFLETMGTVQNELVVLDLKDVRVIDSRGVALCIGLQKECNSKGSPFSIEASPEIHKTFKIFKLTRFIDMREVGPK